MISAKQIKNFIPQNPQYNVPLRVDVKLPIFQRTTNNQQYLGLPNVADVDGGIKFEESKLFSLNNLTTSSAYNSVYPCIPNPNNHIQLKPEPIANSNTFQAPFGNGRGQPKGIASIKQRDALFDYKPPLKMSINNQLAPMMPLKSF